MQPMDQRSEGKLQPSPRITSGALYWRVLIMREWWSSSNVAPPKSIKRMSVLHGNR
ncbi:hypothetical protein MHBO_004928 [Bonamia ostreae]|uniref:Uncharacterized protein n=1 Tax=Bonamia ostreae TaxID=126728 RepID=A0ABV2AVF4_9EUKA